MVPQKQEGLARDIGKCINQLILLSIDCSINMDSKSAKLPTQNFEEPLVEILQYVTRSYKHDYEGLYTAYTTSVLWRTAIRKAFLMDDEDEKGYWFYHMYGAEPNKMFSIYMEEHFPIALEKILEMFERGYRKTFLELNMSPEKITALNLFDHGVEEILTIINERYTNNRLSDAKAVGTFLAWLYLLNKKRIEKIIQEYESVVDEILQEIASICRYTLQHEAKEQLALNLKVA